MGNCLGRSRSGRSGGGGGPVHYSKTNPVWMEEEVGRKEEEEEARKGESAPAAGATKVKIRITRKQLEELLRPVEGGKETGDGVPVRDVISELLYVASTSSNFRHRDEGLWRPSLQSIPE